MTLNDGAASLNRLCHHPGKNFSFPETQTGPHSLPIRIGNKLGEQRIYFFLSQYILLINRFDRWIKALGPHSFAENKFMTIKQDVEIFNLINLLNINILTIHH